MKRKMISVILCAVIVAVFLPVTVSADMGPKPSVHIIFENIGDEECYGTLLSKYDSTGPFSVWDGDEDHIYNYDDVDPGVWRAFLEYKDTDGYFFLQRGWCVSESGELAWTYYPPDTFKILVYFPETDTFVVSDIYERYAFDTYYTVDMDGVKIGSVDYDDELSGNDRIDAYRSYNYTVEFVSLVIRIVLTILLEIGIALLFGYRAKNQLGLIAGVNVVTQIVLNVLLNVINYRSGHTAFVLNYFMLELLVFVIEAAVFYTVLPKLADNDKKKWMTVVYALAANVVSFAAGFWLAEWIPGIF